MSSIYFGRTCRRQLLQTCFRRCKLILATSLVPLCTNCSLRLSRPMSDPQLTAFIQSMNQVLQSTTDDTIMIVAETTNKRIVTLMKIYMHLAHLLYFRDPSLIVDASLRMVELTLKYGHCSESAMAFAYYGERQVLQGHYDLAIRLG